MFYWAPPSGWGLVVVLLFPSHVGSKCQRCIFIRMNRTLERGKAIFTYWKPRVSENPNTPLMALWESNGTIICSASLFILERVLVERVKENYVILTCINNTGVAYINNSHILNACSVSGSLWSASTPYPLFFSPYFPLFSPLAAEYQPQWPPHYSLKTPNMFPSHGIWTCFLLLSRIFSSSIYVHSLLYHFNRSSLKLITKERPRLATFPQ